MRFFRRRRVVAPDPDDGRAPAEVQHALIDALVQAGRDGTMTGDQIATVAVAMGPIRGSYGDYKGERCHHLVPYPGCRGDCRR